MKRKIRSWLWRRRFQGRNCLRTLFCRLRRHPIGRCFRDCCDACEKCIDPWYLKQ